MNRRSLLSTALASLAVLAGAASAAAARDAFPSKPLRLVVPLPPGGPTDTLARAAAQGLSAALGQPVVVENRPGGDGLVAARSVAASPPDGHTLLFATASMIATPLMTSPPSFDWIGELAPVGRVARLAFCAMVHPDVPAGSLAELAAWAKANPGRLAYATSTHSELMAAAQFMRAAGVEMTRVPYKGGTQALPDLVAGRVQVNFGPVTLAQPQAKEGRLRVLATLLPQRSPLLPEVPTAAEAGFPQLDVPTWQAVFAPARTPPEIVATLSEALQAALRDPALRADLEKRALFVDPSTPAQLREAVAAGQHEWSRLIAAFGLGAQ
jgi:tripartite-type tricarboxylate transporter receptor subunit TctC